VEGLKSEVYEIQGRCYNIRVTSVFYFVHIEEDFG